jgi:peptidoglycan/xylan/chitin deacetylase (PgdA/CDA1 family)
MSYGVFIISLDFELHWGGFEKWRLEDYKLYFLRTRHVIPEMLSLFRKHEVHVTWATVGMLFSESKRSLLEVAPIAKPSYKNTSLSAYNYIKRYGIGNDEKDDPYHFADSLIKLIIDTPFQELGSHTFAHYYCNEEGQSVDQFRADLRAAQLAATKYGTKLKSLVFPRNQFNEDYLKTCYEEGFVAVRDNPRDWFWNIQSTQNESLWKRFNRGMDAYLPVGNKNIYSLDSLSVKLGMPLRIPASRLLRPYNPKELFLNKLKINRINNEMERAAQNKEIYHLWWHPHNFGNYPHESLEGLRKILQHFSWCRDKFNMTTLSMGEVANLLNQR